MDCAEANDVKSWTSSRQRCALRSKIYRKITKSPDTAVAIIRWLIEKYTSLKRLLKDELGTDLFVKQASYEVLAMAMHLCESYDVSNEELVNSIVSEIFSSSNNTGVWFQFLNPFGNVNSTITTDSLYPFKPVWKNYNGLREKTWITKRHLKALEYYLTAANEQLFLIRNDLAAKDGGNFYYVGTQNQSDTSNPPVVLIHQSTPDADNPSCINGYYLTLQPNLQAAFHRRASGVFSTNVPNRTFNSIGEVFLDDSNESSDPSSNDSEAIASPLEISSGDDAEVSNITADLVSSIERINLTEDGRCPPVLDSDSSLDSPDVNGTRRRNNSTNTDPDYTGVAVISTTISDMNDSQNDDNTEPIVESQDRFKETRTIAVQTCTYTAVTLVNFPLESSVMGTMTPLTLACLQGAPEATLLLLRYGASPRHTFSQTHCCMHDINQPIYAAVNQLNLFSSDILTAFENYKNALTSLQQNCKETGDIKVSKYLASPIFRDGSRAGYHHSIMFNRGTDWLKCLSYISMVMKVWPLMMTDKETHVHQCPAPAPRLPIQFAEYLPDFCSGNLPPSLQHLCRCTIREKLGSLRRLPKGIQILPLPNSIKDYIDLKE